VLGEQPAMRLGRLAHEHRSDPLGNGNATSRRREKEIRRRADAGPHERRGALEPGDPDVELLERANLHVV
jgi:hypothetical protein